MYQYSSGLWDSTTLRSVNLVEFFFYNVKVKHQVYYWNFVIWKSFFIYKKVQKNVQWSPHAPPLPKLTSNITTVQYQNQETGIGVIPWVHSDFISYTCKCMCACVHVCVRVHVCMCVCVVAHSFIMCSFVQDHPTQNTELFHHHQTLSRYLWRAVFSSLTCSLSNIVI